MKKLFLLLIAPAFLFAQDESFNKAVNNNVFNKIVSTGNSQFTIKVTKEGSSFTSYKKLENFGNNKAYNFPRTQEEKQIIPEIYNESFDLGNNSNN